MKQCTHADELPHPEPEPLSDTCTECRATGTHPVQLRLCLTCGFVGCCDSSPGRHATEH
ncbi:UBP-type domain-containing protein OS=Streptomyces alboniger OX=132473 GN=CP975_23910 PE=4 SV=1 [Streptomyces alboniger]